MTSSNGVAVPRDSGRLPVGEGHSLYWMRFGRTGGVPALLLHGGPGSGVQDFLLTIFDLERFDLLTFDQRGSGRSIPFGRLEGNGPDELVADIERLRVMAGVESWLVVGGSWGATLALAYAERHPERVARLVVWGSWLFRPKDLDWYLNAAHAVMPEAWEAFAAAAGWRPGKDLLACYEERVFDPDPAVHAPAAAAWKTFERQRREPADWTKVAPLPPGPETTNMARIMLHYLRRHCGTLDLLAGAARLSGVTGSVVHGRYDLITPFSGAWELCRRWPGGRLIDCGLAGHTLDQPAIREAVVKALAG